MLSFYHQLKPACRLRQRRRTEEDAMLDNRTETFLAVCHEMSFTKAARTLHVSQPAVSQHIQYLEDYYGTKLFRFEGKKIFLTDAGELLRKSFTALRNNEIYLREQLSMLQNKRNTLRLGATLTVGEYMISDPLIRYLSSHPDSDITVTVANTKKLLSSLDDGKIDFALLEGDYPHASYRHQTYRQEQFIPVCSQSHAFIRRPETLCDLTSESLIIREPGSGTRKIMEQALEDADITLKDFANVITIGNMNTIKELVTADCGITFLYKTAVKKELEDGILKEIELTSPGITHEISIVWKKNNLFEASFEQLFNELFF